MQLSNLTAITPGRNGKRSSLVVADGDGHSVTVPLGCWLDEPRLIDELSMYARAAGISLPGELARRPRRPEFPRRARFSNVTIGLVALATAVASMWAFEGEPRGSVTAETLREAAGVTTQPFTPATRSCSISVVPLDRDAEPLVRPLVSDLRRLVPGFSFCATRSFRLDSRTADDDRGQLNGLWATRLLGRSFWQVVGTDPRMVIGVTTHDMFNPLVRELRFVFGIAPSMQAWQSYAVVSTARMGTGPDRRRRLAVMALRYVGRGFFALAPSEHRHSSMRRAIGSLDDLDEMRPILADRRLTAAELADLRRRVLETLNGR